MTMRTMTTRLGTLALLGTMALAAGCEDKGPAEKAGAKVDQGIQDVKDAVNPPGPAEKAGRAIDKAVKD
jgi:hypothetical protein